VRWLLAVLVAAAAIEQPKMVMLINGLQADAIQDTFNQSRGNGERKHEATDILAPRGTPVHAMVDSAIQKLFLSKPGGNTIYEFANDGSIATTTPTSIGTRKHSPRGSACTGNVIGYVGTTGNADPNTPYLHLVGGNSSEPVPNSYATVGFRAATVREREPYVFLAFPFPFAAGAAFSISLK
jgi:hypothetical protein